MSVSNFLSQPNTTTLVLRLIVAAFFVFMAAKNLSGDPGMAADFERWGYSDSFRSFTAVLQIAGALLLLAPLTVFGACLLLGCVLFGAIATHLRHDPWLTISSPLIVLLILLPVALAHRPERLRL